MSDVYTPPPPTDDLQKKQPQSFTSLFNQQDMPLYFDGKEGGLVDGSIVSDFIEDITARTQGDSYVEKAKVYGSTVLGHALGLKPLQVYENWDSIKDGLLERKAETKEAKRYIDMGVYQAKKNLELGEMGFSLAYLGEDDEVRQKIEELRTEMEESRKQQEELGVSKFVDLLSRTRSLIPYMAQGVHESAKYVLPFTGAGIAAGALTTGPLAPAGALAGGLGGLGTSIATGQALYAMRVEGGQTYLDLTEKGIDPDIARPLSIAAGGLMGAVETVQFLDILSTIPGGKKLFGEGIQKVVGELQKKTRTPLLNRVVSSARHVATETGEEMAQEAIGMLTKEVGTEVSNRLEGTDLQHEWDQFVPTLVETAKQTVGPMALLNVPGLGANIATDIGKQAKRPVVDQDWYTAGEPGEYAPVLDAEWKNVETAEDAEMFKERQERFRSIQAEEIDEAIAAREQEVEQLIENINLDNARQTSRTVNVIEEEIATLREEQRAPEKRQPWQVTKEEFESGVVSEPGAEYGSQRERADFLREEIKQRENRIAELERGENVISEENVPSLTEDNRKRSEFLKNLGDNGVLMRSKENENKYAIVHKSTKPDVAWQISFFDEKGPWGDTQYESFEQMVQDVEQFYVHEYDTFETRGETLLFESWFGDSKVVDEAGKPRVVYHSTKEAFTQFEPRGESEGYWFGVSPHVDMHPQEAGANVIPAYLSLKNPKRVEVSTPEYQAENAEIRKAKEEGHDGIAWTLDGEVVSYTAFDPTQIKSVNNRGTFDPQDPSIVAEEPTLFDNITETEYNDHRGTVHGSKKAIRKEAEELDKQLSLFSPEGGTEGRPTRGGYPNIPGVPEAGQTAVQGTWEKHRRIDFTGTHVGNARTVAELFSVYRHPRLEHFRIIYVDKNDNILAHNAMSSGLPDRSIASEKKNWYQSLYRMEKRMQRLGADGFYLLHNHPSGDVSASQQDFSLTKIYMDNMPGYRGSLIINHDKFNHLTPEAIGTRQDNIQEYNGGKNYAVDIKKTPKIQSPKEVADIGFTALQGEKGSLFLALNNKNHVVAATPIFPKNDKLTGQYIHQLVRNAGAVRGAIVTNDGKAWDSYVSTAKELRGTEFDDIVDVVQVKGGTLVSTYKSAVDEISGFGSPMGTDVVAEKARRRYVFEEGEEFTVAEDEPTYSDPHRESVKKAVEEHQPVPDDVLDDYEYESWAKEEIERRQELRAEAKQFDSADDYVEYHKAMDFDEEYPQAYYAYIWEQAANVPIERIVDRKEGNRRFVESLTKPALTEILYEMAQRDELSGFHGVIVTGGKSAVKNGKLTDAHYKKIMDQIKADPTYYREAFAAVFEDYEEIQRMREESVDPDYEELERLRRDVADLRRAEKKKDKKIETYTFDTHNLRARLRNAEADLEQLQIKYKEELKDLSKSAKAEARKSSSIAKKEALEKQKQHVQDLRERQKEREKYRTYVKKLIADIFRPPSTAIKYSYQVAIREIQKAHSLKGPQSKEYKLRERMKEWAKEAPEAVTPDILAETSKRSVHDLTLEELEEMRTNVATLRERGRWERDKDILDERILINKAQRDITRQLTGSEEIVHIPAAGSKETTKEMKAGAWKGFQAHTLRPSRLFNLLDGGKDGIITKWLYTEINKAEDQSLRGVDARTEPAHQKMQELGITAASLGNRLRHKDKSFTVDEVLSMYIGIKNDDSRKALLYGNEIDANMLIGLIRQLTPEQKEWADYMMQDFDQHYNRVNEALLKDQNRSMKAVDSYFPIRRQDVDYHELNAEMAEDILMRSGVSRTYVGKGFTKERTMKNPQYQLPMRLGAMNLWMDQVAKQEKYIAQALLIKRLHRIFGDWNVKKAITSTAGEQFNKMILKYIDDVANPNIYKAMGGAGKVSRMLRQNAALSYLSFNAITMLKQAPSAAYYLGHAGPFDLMASAAQFTGNMRKTIEFVESRDPQMKHRSMERVLEELKVLDGGIYKKVIKQVGKYGMWPIKAMDKAMTTIGWKATYDRSIRKGLSEEEAIQAAQKATLTTQPAARAKDIAEIYRSGEGWNWLLMFTNQLNQIWNIVSYDVPNNFRQGEAIAGMMQISGIVIGSLVMGMIARKRAPEDMGEVATDIVNQIFSAIPIFGGNLKAGFQGWLFSTGVDPFPMAKELGSTLRKLTEDGADVDDLTRLVTEGMVALGIPTVTPKRIYTAIETGDAWELIGGPPED